MDDKKYIEELAWKLFSDTHAMWTELERKNAWEESNNIYRQRYTWLAEISFRYFQSIYYSL